MSEPNVFSPKKKLIEYQFRCHGYSFNGNKNHEIICVHKYRRQLLKDLTFGQAVYLYEANKEALGSNVFHDVFDEFDPDIRKVSAIAYYGENFAFASLFLAFSLSQNMDQYRKMRT